MSRSAPAVSGLSRRMEPVGSTLTPSTESTTDGSIAIPPFPGMGGALGAGGPPPPPVDGAPPRRPPPDPAVPHRRRDQRRVHGGELHLAESAGHLREVEAVLRDLRRRLLHGLIEDGPVE